MQKFLSGILYILIWILSLPPLKILYFGSWIGFLLIHHVFKYRHDIIYSNLEKSFPDFNKTQLEDLTKKYHKHLSQVFSEAIKAMHWPVGRMKERIQLSNPEYFAELLKSGKNIIVLAGHTGNWEWLPALIAPYGYDVLGVYKPQTSKVFDEFTFKMRQKESVTPIAMRETARAMKKAGADEKPKALLLIADQIPAKPDIHFWEDFLNQKTAWFTGGEKIAQKYDLPIVFMKVMKSSPGRYVGSIVPISINPGQEKEGDISRKYIAELENNILAQPENWLWSHRRWKHQPEDLSL